jgi:predicted GTPase
VIFCNHHKYLDEHYKRYLEARIREQVPYTGLPMLFHFRGREERGKE